MYVLDGPGVRDSRPSRTAGLCVERLAARLATAADAQRPALIADFWAEVERRGAPLVEQAAGSPGRYAVTFLWRGHRATCQVLLLADGLTDPGDLTSALLDRLPGTDVWHLTYLLPAGSGGAYRLAADISPGGPPADPGRLRQRLRALCVYAAADPLNSHPDAVTWSDSDGSVYAVPAAAG
ncbi:enterochelin esterase domain-containing protein [Streptomyces ochraceiscleroticus]|uniref:Enterochelin esterase domain-containing protein n=1 Tax=Streptomyces ochraceiscleroticus TaxID=47761 RepID=A0ABW1MUM6_9ACTN|nr:enterochelin esterase domain-containing protein [Streptomyces ochraceiscleroticus]